MGTAIVLRYWTLPIHLIPSSLLSHFSLRLYVQTHMGASSYIDNFALRTLSDRDGLPGKVRSLKYEVRSSIIRELALGFYHLSLRNFELRTSNFELFDPHG